MVVIGQQGLAATHSCCCCCTASAPHIYTLADPKHTHLAVGDGAHKRGLADAVGAAQAVAVAAHQAHQGVVEQDLGAIGEGELAVAQLLALLLRMRMGDSWGFVSSRSGGGQWDVCGGDSSRQHGPSDTASKPT